MGSEDKKLILTFPQRLRMLEIYGSMDEMERLYYSYGCIMQRQDVIIVDSVLSRMFYDVSEKLCSQGFKYEKMPSVQNHDD